MKDAKISGIVDSLSVDFMLMEQGDPVAVKSFSEKAAALKNEFKKAGKKILRTFELLASAAVEAVRDSGSGTAMAAVKNYLDLLQQAAEDDGAIGGDNDETAGLETKSLPEKLKQLMEALRAVQADALAAANEKVSAAAASAVEILEKCIKGENIDSAGAVKPEANEGALGSSREKPPEKDTYRIKGDLQLVNDFISEAKEHAESADAALLVLEKEKNNTEAINAVFRCFHTLKSLAGFLELEEIFVLVRETENLLHKIRKNEIDLNEARIDVLFESVDMLKRMINSLYEAVKNSIPAVRESGLIYHVGKIQQACNPEGAAPAAKKVGEVLVETGKVTETQINESLEEQKRNEGQKEKLGELLVKKNFISRQDLNEALGMQTKRDEAAGRASKVRETLKIDSDKLDRLIDTIGEIVIAESMIHSETGIIQGASSEFYRNLGHLTKTTKRLHEFGLSLRLVPMGPSFQKLARITRDLARVHGKRVDFRISGEETEIDRSVVEKMNDPLVHMIRNAVDHGIERTQDERKKIGKNEIAIISINAFHRSGNVVIELEDDGRGLDTERIMQRAYEMGLAQKGIAYTDEQVYQFIFHAGFSTAQIVTDTSGRGVGMDVVRKNVEELHGKISVRTEKNRGTRFSISLPLTTAIIDAMLLRTHEDKYFLPTLSIIESFRPHKGEVSTVKGRGMAINFRGELVPVFSLAGFFKGGHEDVEELPDKVVVIVETEMTRLGLIVDELIDQQQIVVKSLGNGIDKVAGVAGCTVMNDGKVGLIIDAAEIMKTIMGQELVV